MKRIAIFCDGTWNTSSLGDPTHVVELAQAVDRTDPKDGTKQVVFYQPGVGTGTGFGKTVGALNKYLGGALGIGLTANIRRAYRFLNYVYEPGDEIYVFGFSRGAFTARSLVGLIRKCGLPMAENSGGIPEAMKRYASTNKGDHPDSDVMLEFRRGFSPNVATSPKDLAERETPATLLNIRYLGVWDTVGGIGLPMMPDWIDRRLNGRFRFHDTELSSIVRGARHAIAADERRKPYDYTPFGNLPRLNGETAGPERPYQQLWFPGEHGVVGGSRAPRGLSAATMHWVAQGAVERGLSIASNHLDRWEFETDAGAGLEQLHQKAGLISGAVYLRPRRRKTGDCSDLSPTIRARAEKLPQYRPPPVKDCL